MLKSMLISPSPNRNFVLIFSFHSFIIYYKLGTLVGSRDIKTKAVLVHVKFTVYCGRSYNTT